MKPKIYLLCGLPGTGKTTYAKKTHQEINAVVFSIDEEVIKKYGILNDQKEYEKCEILMKEKIYNKTRDLILGKKDVILDFGFWKKEDRKKYINLGKMLSIETVICYFPFNQTIKERLLKRNKNLPKNTYNISENMIDKFIKQFEIPKENECELKIINR